ncbi:MAG: flagellin, partial [Methanocorpusculum sp.]|nr:flagellin [Methanocorpusculum sp.]
MVKKDEGIAAVVAVMLILAVVVTCMTLYTTVYVPQLKQAAEIEHSGDVQIAFERFASDVDTLYANGKNASYAEVVELGGGDVFLSPVKSSGTILIENQTIGSLYVGGVVTKLNTTLVSYQPSYSS